MKQLLHRLTNVIFLRWGIAIFLAVMQVFLFSGTAYSQKSTLQGASENDQPWQDKRIYKEELVQLRDRTSKHFQNNSGTTTAFLTAGTSLHYLHNGIWEEIDNKIQSNSSSSYPYAATKNQFLVYYGNSASAGVKLNIASNEIVFKSNFAFGASHSGQEHIISQSTHFQPSAPVGASITYNQILPGVNFTAKQMNDAIKYDFNIQNNQTLINGTENAQELFFRQSIVVPAGSQVSTRNGSEETGNSGKIAEISISNANGEAILKMEMPYYYDAAQNSDGIYGWYSYEYVGNELIVNTIIPASWAKSTARVFPLTIDPVVSVYPDLTAFWSGSVRDNGTANENASGAFTGRSASSGYWHYWAKFNNSSIPDGSTINTVTGNFYRNVTFAYPVAVCRLDFDPVAATGFARFTGIVAATGVYIASVSYPAGAAWITHALGASGATDLAASLPSDYFSIGLRSNTTATGNVGRVHTHNQTNKPYLSVDYTPGGPPVTPACFQSVASGNWEDVTTWESKDNCTGGWVAATAIPGANSLGVNIQTGHNVTINTAVTCSLTTVQLTASIIVATGGTLTVSNGAGTDLDVIGTLQNTGGSISANAGALINVSGVYEHARNGDAIPTATWQATSDCKITGMTTTTPTNLAQSFGNLTWQSPAQTGNAVLTGTNNPLNVQGLFLYASVGGGILDLSNVNRTWTGDLYAGAVVALMRGTASGISTLTVNNLTINDTYTSLGRLLLNNSTSAASITVTLNVLGNVLINPSTNVNVIGMNTFGSATLPISVIDVRGNWTQTNGFSSSAASQSQAVIRFTGVGVKTFNRTAGSFNNINFSVFSPAILDMGNNVLNNVGNFTLTSGASLRIGSADGISASGATGNIQNTVGSRNFTSTSNYIYYNAYGVGQQITGDGLPASVSNLSFENSQGTVLTNSSVSITGILSNTGLFILDDSKSLVQGPLSTNAGSGNYKISRQGSAGTFNNFWSSPITAANINILGTSVFQYSPALGTVSTADDQFDPGWIAATGLQIPGKGYTKAGAGLVVFNGTLNNAPTSSPISIAVTKDAISNVGFNLVGNPFSSAIVGSTFLTNNSAAIDGTIWLWDQSAGTGYTSADYATINSLGATSGGGTQTPNGNVASGQGFFVHRSAAGSGSVEFRNAQRSITGNNQFFDAGEIARVWLNVTSPNQQYNELLIGFKADATEGFDPMYDSKKFSGNGSISFYSVLGDDDLAIQGLPYSEQGRTIQLGLKTKEAGLHRISLKATEFLKDGELIFLEDTYLHTFQCLNVSPEFEFTPTGEPMVNRFVLHFQPGLNVSVTKSGCDGLNGSISAVASGSSWSYVLRNVQHQIVSEGSSTQSMNANTLAAGNYELAVQYENGYSYVQVIAIESEQPLVTEIQNATETLTLDQAIIEFNATGEANWTYTWNFGDGTSNVVSQEAIHEYMAAGIYTVQLRVSNGTCTTETSKIITVLQPEVATGINTIENSEIFAFPNPASNQVTLLLRKPSLNQQISIFDHSGRMIYTTINTNGSASIQFSTGNFANGIYFVKISNNEGCYSIPLTILHH